MDFTIVASLRAQHQIQHQKALAAGLRVHGIKSVEVSHAQAKTKYVACWGWRNGKVLREAGHEVLVMERGYLGDRFSWSSLAWNGLNGRAQFAPAPNDGGKRFVEHFAMQPWKQGGQYVLVMGQVPGDASLQGRDLMPWYRQVANEAKAIYGLPVHFRAHPLAVRKGYKQIVVGTEKSRGELSRALAGAALVITFNSNSAVDSVLAGVPTVALDEGSMAWPVVGHSLAEKITPNRGLWAAELAWRQWRLSEISDGSALVNLLGMKHG